MDEGGAKMSALANASSVGTRKAAILLSLLGESEAAPILRNMPGEFLERLTVEVARLPQVPPELTLQVLEEYKQMMVAQEYMATGGEDVAVRLLVNAFGENGAKTMVQRLTQGDGDPSLDLLRKTDTQKLARFLAGEHGQTKALVLGLLDSKQASELLMKFEPDVRADCIRRMATMGQFSPEAVAKATRVISRRFGLPGATNKRIEPGVKNLSELMNHLEPNAAREILSTIEIKEPALADNIRDRMFTFEDFNGVPEQDLRELINSLDKKTLMVALKGSSDSLRDRVYRTMSSRAVELMKEDSEMMGPVRSKDVSSAQREIIAIARKLEAEGKIVLRSQGDEYVV
jgi:flagellar motor switch protein FliG